MDKFKLNIMEKKVHLIDLMYRDIYATAEIANTSCSDCEKIFARINDIFSKDVFMETVVFDFREDELDKINESEEMFLDVCWNTWKDSGGSIKELVRRVVNDYAQGLYDCEEVDDDEDHCT